jgi:hypothetical protein
MHPSMHFIWNRFHGIQSFLVSVSLIFILFPGTLYGGERRDSAVLAIHAPDSAKTAALGTAVSNFHGFSTPNSVQLVWNTLTESVNAVFQIEKWNGVAFEAIGRVEKLGTSFSPFVFEDNYPQAGSNLYRVICLEGEQPVYQSQTKAVFLAGAEETHPVIMTAVWQGADSMFVTSNYHADRKVQAFLISETGEATYLNEIAFNNKGVAVIPAKACGLQCRLVLFEPHWQQFCHVE